MIARFPAYEHEVESGGTAYFLNQTEQEYFRPFAKNLVHIYSPPYTYTSDEPVTVIFSSLKTPTERAAYAEAGLQSYPLVTRNTGFVITYRADDAVPTYGCSVPAQSVAGTSGLLVGSLDGSWHQPACTYTIPAAADSTTVMVAVLKFFRSPGSAGTLAMTGGNGVITKTTTWLPSIHITPGTPGDTPDTFIIHNAANAALPMSIVVSSTAPSADVNFAISYFPLATPCPASASLTDTVSYSMSSQPCGTIRSHTGFGSYSLRRWILKSAMTTCRWTLANHGSSSAFVFFETMTLPLSGLELSDSVSWQFYLSTASNRISATPDMSTPPAPLVIKSGDQLALTFTQPACEAAAPYTGCDLSLQGTEWILHWMVGDASAASRCALFNTVFHEVTEDNGTEPFTLPTTSGTNLLIVSTPLVDGFTMNLETPVALDQSAMPAIAYTSGQARNTVSYGLPYSFQRLAYMLIYTPLIYSGAPDFALPQIGMAPYPSADEPPTAFDQRTLVYSSGLDTAKNLTSYYEIVWDAADEPSLTRTHLHDDGLKYSYLATPVTIPSYLPATSNDAGEYATLTALGGRCGGYAPVTYAWGSAGAHRVLRLLPPSSSDTVYEFNNYDAASWGEKVDMIEDCGFGLSTYQNNRLAFFSFYSSFVQMLWYGRDSTIVDFVLVDQLAAVLVLNRTTGVYSVHRYPRPTYDGFDLTANHWDELGEPLPMPVSLSFVSGSRMVALRNGSLLCIGTKGYMTVVCLDPTQNFAGTLSYGRVMMASETGFGMELAFSDDETELLISGSVHVVVVRTSELPTAGGAILNMDRLNIITEYPHRFFLSGDATWRSSTRVATVAESTRQLSAGPAFMVVQLSWKSSDTDDTCRVIPIAAPGYEARTDPTLVSTLRRAEFTAIECPLGSHKAYAGYGFCKLCPGGTSLTGGSFQNETGQAFCYPCPAGYECPCGASSPEVPTSETTYTTYSTPDFPVEPGRGADEAMWGQIFVPSAAHPYAITFYAVSAMIILFMLSLCMPHLWRCSDGAWGVRLLLVDILLSFDQSADDEEEAGEDDKKETPAGEDKANESQAPDSDAPLTPKAAASAAPKAGGADKKPKEQFRKISSSLFGSTYYLVLFLLLILTFVYLVVFLTSYASIYGVHADRTGENLNLDRSSSLQSFWAADKTIAAAVELVSRLGFNLNVTLIGYSFSQCEQLCRPPTSEGCEAESGDSCAVAGAIRCQHTPPNTCQIDFVLPATLVLSRDVTFTFDLGSTLVQEIVFSGSMNGIDDYASLPETLVKVLDAANWDYENKLRVIGSYFSIRCRLAQNKIGNNVLFNVRRQLDLAYSLTASEPDFYGGPDSYRLEAIFTPSLGASTGINETLFRSDEEGSNLATIALVKSPFFIFNQESRVTTPSGAFMLITFTLLSVYGTADGLWATGTWCIKTARKIYKWWTHGSTPKELSSVSRFVDSAFDCGALQWKPEQSACDAARGSGQSADSSAAPPGGGLSTPPQRDLLARAASQHGVGYSEAPPPPVGAPMPVSVTATPSHSEMMSEVPRCSSTGLEPPELAAADPPGTAIFTRPPQADS